MRRILILGLGLSAAMGVLAGCTEESATSVGGDLIGEGFRTFEVVLDGQTFLESDTTYDRLGTLNGAPFALVAENYAGELFAHTIFRVRPPTQVTYQSASGASITDTAFTVVGATVTLVVDSLGDATAPIDIQVLEVTESWDPATVTWEQRVDTADVAEPWTVPGGTTGQILGVAAWATGDTVRIPLDSAAAAVWMDSAAANHGGLIRLTTDGARLRIQGLGLQFDARPAGADTIVQAGRAGVNVIVATPEPSTPDGSELRVGGIPSWRSALQFKPLADVLIPCTDGSTTCTVPLADVAISQATLLLEPLIVGGRRIERPHRVEGRGILRGPGVPVTRSPLSLVMGTAPALPPEAFSPAPSEAYDAALPITGFIRQNIDPGEGREAVFWLALLAQSEQSPSMFGYAEFGSLQSAVPPRLRLMVTVPAQEEIQ